MHVTNCLGKALGGTYSGRILFQSHMPVFSRVKSQPRSMTQTRGWRASPSHARDEKLILETVSNYLDTDATREKIRREIRRLANTIVGIEDDFAKVSSKLEHLDPSQLIRDFGGVAAKVQEWKAIHNVCEVI